MARPAAFAAEEPCPACQLPTYKSDDCFASYIKSEEAAVVENQKNLDGWKANLAKETAKCNDKNCPGVFQASGMIDTYAQLVRCCGEIVTRLKALSGSCTKTKCGDKELVGTHISCY